MCSNRVWMTILGLLFCTRVSAADQLAVGTGVDPTFGALYVGVEGGIFKKYDIDPQLKLFASGAASTPYLISGDIQVSLAGPPAGILAHAKAPQIQ